MNMEYFGYSNPSIERIDHVDITTPNNPLESKRLPEISLSY